MAMITIVVEDTPQGAVVRTFWSEVPGEEMTEAQTTAVYMINAITEALNAPEKPLIQLLQ